MPMPDDQTVVLAVDDSEDTLELISRHLQGTGVQVLLARGAAQAIEQLTQAQVDLVVTDLRMPGISGLDLVRHIRENFKDTEVLMITGFPSVEGAVEAMRWGAADYLPKPFTAGELRKAVSRALERLRTRRAVRAAESGRPVDLRDFVAGSDAMRPVLQAIRRQSGLDEPVLLEGEAGTGRRSIALAIHLAGPRTRENFVEVACSLYPPDRVTRVLLGLRDRKAPG
jgi:DNA-binding NtrC family response regulator